MKYIASPISGLLILSLLMILRAEKNLPVTVDQIRGKYPRAHVSIVSQNEYNQLLRQAQAEGLNPILLADASGSVSENEDNPAVDEVIQEDDQIPAADSLCDTTFQQDSLRCRNSKSQEDSIAPAQESPPGHPDKEIKINIVNENSLDTYGAYIIDIGHHQKRKKSKSESDSESDLAAFVLVVIGTVVVAGFLVIGGKILYDMVVNKKNFPVWRDASVLYAYSGRSLGSGAYPEHTEDTYLLSGRFAIGWQRRLSAIGIGAELGYIGINVFDYRNYEDLFFLNGYYLLIGPELRFGKLNPLALKLSFYNGTSNRSSIGLISQARADLQVKINGPFYFGINFGSFYADIDYSDGFLFKNWGVNDKFSLLYGVHFGYAF